MLHYVFDSLVHVSPRPCAPREMDGVSVSEITVGTVSNVACVALSFLQKQPTLCKYCLRRVPPACMSLRSANGSPWEVLGFVSVHVTLGDVCRPIDALVILSQDPDRILLDNPPMSRSGAVVDWKRQHILVK